MRPFATRCVYVHPRYSRVWESVAENPLHLLRAEDTLSHGSSAAASALRVQRLVMTTVVAQQPFGRLVMRQRDAAIRTHHHVPAIDALHESGITPAIQQQDGLLAARERLGYRRVQSFAEDRSGRCRLESARR